MMSTAAATEPLGMNSAKGKGILSLIRDADYAHAGEAEAVELALAHIVRNPHRAVLDVGCGLGGTANFIAERGLGRVTGVDIDKETISYATARYPKERFVAGSALEISRLLEPQFDLVTMFNSLYTFGDQAKALREAHDVTTANAQLVIFDYTYTEGDPRAEPFMRAYARSPWRALGVASIPALVTENGWRLDEVIDVSAQYGRWYSDLVSRINAKRDDILRISDDRWFQYARKRYQDLLDAVQEGIIGGAIVRATRA